MNRFLLFSIFIVFLSCAKTKNSTVTVRFAGEIVNPTNGYVVLLKGDRVIDTARLDVHNRFSFVLDGIEDGLYNFKHEPEHQYVFLERGDSLQLRLNTSDFDESLVFSGDNEEVNNFLLELFLADERIEADMHKTYYEMDPADFSETIQGLRKEKLSLLDELREEVPISNMAYDIAKASINYTYYRYNEIYPFEHKRKLKEHTIHDMPNGFYDYRANINYNSEQLVYLRPYYNFMKSHFGNISYMACADDCDANGAAIRNKLHFNKHKLRVIDSLVKGHELRDNLFRNVAIDYLLKSHDVPQNNEIFIKEFKAVAGNNIHQEEINKLYNAIQSISPNNTIPNVQLLDFYGDSVSIMELSKNRKTIYYFWSSANKRHYENMFKRVADLKRQNIGYDLVGINLRTDSDIWHGIINQYNLDPAKQFMASDAKDITEKLVVWFPNKCILTDGAVIVDAFSNIYDRF